MINTITGIFCYLLFSVCSFAVVPGEGPFHAQNIPVGINPLEPFQRVQPIQPLGERLSPALPLGLSLDVSWVHDVINDPLFLPVITNDLVVLSRLLAQEDAAPSELLIEYVVDHQKHLLPFFF